jgi:hypothetical protein
LDRDWKELKEIGDRIPDGGFRSVDEDDGWEGLRVATIDRWSRTSTGWDSVVRGMDDGDGLEIWLWWGIGVIPYGERDI